jgi:branched-subunit amino acid aminotransferase/4-amino-4-deoxychorismate lyase
MTVLAVAVQGRGLVAPGEPVFTATDDALQRGSAAFETVRVYGGRPFLLDRHVERLTHSAAVLGLPAPEGAFELVRLLAGVAPPDHVLRLLRADEVFVATAAALPGGLDEQRARGLALHTFHHEPVPLLDGVKSTSYAPALAARRAAEAAGADDALFVSGGRVLECATANVWWSAGGKLHTPAAGPGVLAGVTRGLLLELEDDVVESSGLEELLAADEAFTTSSIREVMPVRSVDGRAIGDGRPGPAAVRLQAALRLRSSL